jgi:acyl carrier protein
MSPVSDGLSVLAGLLAEATGEPAAWAEQVRADARLEGDLLLDSLEVAALAELLSRAYGDRVDLMGFLAGLGIDELIGLTVGDVAAYVARSTAATG